ncbi:MAG TPA: glycoside hydrolase family 16 protein [Candidatus Saccharibacteria bacterium]|nr:glycoside hydrolase family 16 protein [Candidatus Saccharibacteria bacterium]
MARTKTKLSRKKTASRGLALGAKPLSSVRGFLGNKRIVVIVVIFSFVGGFFVYQSQAAGVEWRPGNTSVTTNLKRITKKDGLAYWYSMQPTIPPANTDQGGVLPPYSTIGELVLNDEKQGSGTYCAEVQTAGLAGGVRFSGANAQLPLSQLASGRYTFAEKTKGEACVTANLAVGPLTVIIERKNTPSTNTSEQPLIVHRLFKKDFSSDFNKKCSELSHLKFCDDFDGPAGSLPDNAKWRVFKSGSSWGAQCWTAKPENIATDGKGALKLTLVDTKANQCTNSYGDQSTITSGGMDTQGKFTTKYGRFEIRTKLACAKSVWGSVWLSTGTGPSWPQSGEIDIYEIGYDKQNTIQQTIHAGRSNSDKYSIETYAQQASRYCDDYHVYGVEWREGYIQFMLDGKPTNRITEADGAADAAKSGKSQYWPFNSYDLRLLIDLQYGKAGTWTGGPNVSELPSSMLVDYVRVYQ